MGFVGFKQYVVYGGILKEILQAFTRYSANDPELPVNDPPLFTGAKPDDFPTRLNVASNRSNDRAGASNTVTIARTRTSGLVRERSSMRSEAVRAGLTRQW
jgi:hypothetical protein